MKRNIKILIVIGIILIGAASLKGYNKYKDYHAIADYSVDHAIISLVRQADQTKQIIDQLAEKYSVFERDKTPVLKEELLRIYDRFAMVIYEIENVTDILRAVKGDTIYPIAKRFDLFQYTRQQVMSNENTEILLSKDEWYEILSFSIICENISRSGYELRINQKTSGLNKLLKLYDQLLERNKGMISPYNF